MLCKKKHLYQSDIWKCPNCGDTESFYVAESESEDCPGLHPHDIIECDACRHVWTGEKLSNVMRNKDGVDVMQCPHCHGRGYIRKPTK